MEPQANAPDLEAAWDWAMREAFVQRNHEVLLRADDALGDFRIVREIGRGGMAVVYEAQQVSLNRRVALKVLPYHVTLDAVAVARFRREATLAARLHHPGIVDIHTVGSSSGTHYFAMEFLEGAPLDRVLELARRRAPRELTGATLEDAVRSACHRPDGVPMDAGAAQPPPRTWRGDHARTVVELAAQIADALDHAHGAGVVHRDVKPANVLIRPDGTAVLTDFGLASMGELPALTLCGQFTGTPSYVSPEQARSERGRIDRRSDVFSLGVTLYEMLTLRLPFDGRTAQAVFQQIGERDPIDPRRLNPAIDRTLSNIVLRALEKAPERRYPTARAFAGDLRAWLAGEPVTARPAPAALRIWRKIRHRRAEAVAILALIAAAFAVGSHLVRTGRATEMAYWGDLQRAQSALRTGAVSQARSVLAACPEFLRGFEWSHLAQRCEAADDPAREPVAALPVRGEHGVMCVAVGADGRRIAAGSHDQMVRVWDLATGTRSSLLAGHVGPVNRIAFHPDGTRVFTAAAEADCSVRAWDLENGTCSWVWRSANLASGLACHPAGEVVAVGCRDGRILLLDVERANVVGEIATEVGAIGALCFGPDGRTVTAGGADGKIEVWEIGTVARRATLDGHHARIRDLAFHPDGEHLYSVCADGTMRAWDVPNSTCIGSVSGDSPVRSVAVSPDGGRVVCGHHDASVRCHDATRLELAVRLGDAGPGVLSLAFDPGGGERLVTGSTIDGVRIFAASSAVASDLHEVVEAARRASTTFVGLHRRFGSEPADAAWLTRIVDHLEASSDLDPELRLAVRQLAEETALRVAYANLRSSHAIAIRASRSAADYEKALRQAELAWRVGPGTPLYEFNVAMLLSRVGRPRDAIEWLDRADASNGAGPEFFNPAWSTVFRAICEHELGEPESARRLLLEVRGLPAQRRDYLVESFLAEAGARIDG